MWANAQQTMRRTFAIAPTPTHTTALRVPITASAFCSISQRPPKRTSRQCSSLEDKVPSKTPLILNRHSTLLFCYKQPMYPHKKPVLIVHRTLYATRGVATSDTTAALHRPYERGSRQLRSLLFAVNLFGNAPNEMRIKKKKA